MKICKPRYGRLTTMSAISARGVCRNSLNSALTVHPQGVYRALWQSDGGGTTGVYKVFSSCVGWASVKICKPRYGRLTTMSAISARGVCRNSLNIAPTAHAQGVYTAAL